MATAIRLLGRFYCALIPIIGVLWILQVQEYMGFALVAPEVIGVILGVTIAAAFIVYPYGKQAGLLEILLGLAGLAAWVWMSMNYTHWLVDMANRPAQKWVPGVIGIVLMMETMRKACGLAITILVWVLIGYFLTGHLFPGILETEYVPVDRAVLQIYADSNGVPGIVMTVIIGLVLAFIVMGKVMEVSGATRFFTDLAMAWMGHRRGGPAKVAVVASSVFGTISGSTVGNIMSTGIVTIPLMIQAGFKRHHAAAIEAVASNGGQIAPPVMGATAFLIAEFMDATYAEVVIAAIVPAAIYYLALFSQVDAFAVRHGLRGLAKGDLPKVRTVARTGWVFVVPLAVLIYFIFWLGYNAGLSALYATATLFVLMVVRNRALPTRDQWIELFAGSGKALLPLMLIGAGAGVVVGVLNFTGLGFQLTLILKSIAAAHGLFAMLVVTALIAIVLGMGMPTAAVYVVLSIVLIPALIRAGVQDMSAHLFVFYYGLLSMLTPPVAVASYVAGGLAGANMWRTGITGMQLAAAAYLLPFLWAFNPAVLLFGSWLACFAAVATASIAALLLGRMVILYGRGGLVGSISALATFALALAVGGATLWAGPESPVALIVAAAATVAWFVTRNGVPGVAAPLRSVG
jgi:TRAP transporter 4TM/12TM fusion protein